MTDKAGEKTSQINRTLSIKSIKYEYNRLDINKLNQKTGENNLL